MMEEFDPEMYRPEEVVFYRQVPATSSQGGPRRTFPEAGEDMVASVQSQMVDRSDAQGRVYTTLGYSVYTPTDPRAQAGDKFEWRGRTLVAEGPTDPKGIGGVTWLTRCTETR